jgi:diguanylate cyclase (GGDEF)-like protein
VARALRAVFEDAPRAQYRSAVVLASLVVPFGALIALRGGATARPLLFALSLLVGIGAVAWIVRERVLSERAWAVMAPLSAVGFALGAASMQHDRDLLLALLVVPVAYFGVYMRSALVGLALLCYGIAAATPIVLADTRAQALTSFGARIVGIVVTAAVTHGLAMSLRGARGTGTRIAESLDDSLYTLEQTEDGPVSVHFLGGRERAERLLGGALPEHPTLAEIWTTALHPEDRSAYDESQQALLRGEPRDLEYRLTGVDGRVRWIWDRGWPQLLRDGRLMVDGIVTDVTERRRMDSELAEARENLDRIVESIDESLYTLVEDQDGRWSCLYAGPGWELILGGPLPPGAELHQVWRERVHPDDLELFLSGDRRLRAGQPIEDQYRVRGFDGVDRWLLHRAKPRRLHDGRVVVDGICIDISTQRRDAERLQAALAQAESLAAELARAAQIDVLTGAASRQHLQQELGRAVAEAGQESGGRPGLLVLDVDHFKRINDSFGHVVGDEVLVAVANRLRRAARGRDLVARLGGEEFCLLVQDVEDERQLRDLAERVRVEVAGAAVFTQAGGLAVTVSIGGSLFGDDAGDTLLHDADLAMYSAKRRGRNRSRMFSDLTADDLVAEEPEAIRLAQGLAWTASAHEGLAEHHCEQVADLAARIAERLELPASQVLRTRLGGWLHDVGKVAVADEILNKPAPLDPAEWGALRRHVEVGEQIVRRIDRLADAAVAVRHHHERFDGSGYPDALVGEQIPIEARIVAAADTFSAMTHERAYSQARGDAEAVHELRRIAGTHLDPAVVEALIASLADTPQVIGLPRREADQQGRSRRREDRAS